MAGICWPSPIIILREYSHEEGKSLARFSPRAEAVFTSYAWLKNIRQLQNAVRNIVALNEGKDVSLAMLPALLTELAEGIVETMPEPIVRSAVDGETDGASFIPQNEKSIRPLEDVAQEIVE